MKRLAIIAALLLAWPAAAQQPQTPEQATEIMRGIGAQWALQMIESQRRQIAELTAKCGDPCKPPVPPQPAPEPPK